MSAGCGQRQVQLGLCCRRRCCRMSLLLLPPPLLLLPAGSVAAVLPPTLVQRTSSCPPRSALFFNTGRVQSSRLPQKMGLQSDDVSPPADPAELIFCNTACPAFPAVPLAARLAHMHLASHGN